MVKEFVNNIRNNKIMVNNLGIQKNLNRRNLQIIIISRIANKVLTSGDFSGEVSLASEALR